MSDFLVEKAVQSRTEGFEVVLAAVQILLQQQLSIGKQLIVRVVTANVLVKGNTA
jgi:hypothetical protein